MRYLILFFILFISCTNNVDKKTTLSGNIYGTSYTIVYFSQDELQLKVKVDSLFNAIDMSMSTYNSNSLISKINNNKDVELDNHFKFVFNVSKNIYRNTNGYFDPSIGPLVNHLDFGPKTNNISADRLMNLVGLNKFKIAENKLIRPFNSFLDFNAIAKGYSVDVISGFLSLNNITNFLVEVGGEIRSSGINLDSNKSWRVGLDTPRFDGLQNDLYAIFNLNDMSMATSGVYRKFKLDSLGNKYAHIIDPKTGYSSTTNILSVTVISDSCIEADAYATALHLMTVDEISIFANKTTDISIFVIYNDENNQMQDISFNNFPSI
ncbi:FAD:protein FMN transferase [Flavobacteriaceae bacterium]|nr:FAD:protein FMN transferase [Flavobacteriaceae bacterium]MDB9712809.1 FAD:protein FMN transferase [Flavobacteriaceae bacterium]MDC1492519.1 FAD:protein FMN transferase [Flavobacteriaceae bacterium]MDC1534801.1 FAD:protein FMN transferase [Flavobacteriaceae bacterium]